jgi:F0F1-type ATP synthase assembly protein I
VRKVQKFSVVNKILVGQAFITLLVVTSFFMFGSYTSTKSALYGGMAALIKLLIFAYQ